MTPTTFLRWPLYLALATLCALPATAQDNKKASREREALRRAQQQVTSANQALAEAQAKLKTVEDQQQLVEADARKARARAQAVAAQNKQLETELAALKQERVQLQTQYQQASARGTQLDVQLKGLQTELEQARRVAQQQSVHIGGQRQQLAACESRNTGLYNAGRTLLDECRSFVTEAPPVLNLQGLGGNRQVARENALETHRDKLEQHRTPPAETAAAR